MNISKHLSKLGAVVVMATVSAQASATLTVIHEWRMGDGQTAGNPAGAVIQDEVGSFDVNRTGSPDYSAINGFIGVDFENAGSAFNVPATQYYSSGDNYNPTDATRWGVEAIVRIDIVPATNQELAVIDLGESLILQTFGDGAWGLHRPGVAITNAASPVLAGQVQHLAAVNNPNTGLFELYVDGVLAGSVGGGAIDPAAGIRIAAGAFGGSNNRGFDGTIDVARIFEFTGAFDIDETLFGTPIPEPASIALLGLGGLMMLRRRRA